MSHYIGVDVGTGSARAGLVTLSGRLVAKRSKPISSHSPEPGFYEQSSEEIWAAVVECVRGVMQEGGKGTTVNGVGFDATCSMVLIGMDGEGIG